MTVNSCTLYGDLKWDIHQQLNQDSCTVVNFNLASDMQYLSAVLLHIFQAAPPSRTTSAAKKAGVQLCQDRLLHVLPRQSHQGQQSAQNTAMPSSIPRGS